jgi:hypothetical protein
MASARGWLELPVIRRIPREPFSVTRAPMKHFIGRTAGRKTILFKSEEPIFLAGAPGDGLLAARTAPRNGYVVTHQD